MIKTLDIKRSKQEIGEIKEIQRENLSQKWEKDKHVTACTLCAKPFNISRRKVSIKNINV